MKNKGCIKTLDFEKNVKKRNISSLYIVHLINHNVYKSI